MDYNKFIKEISMFEHPEKLEDLDKISCSLYHGNRVYWYYQEDVEYAKECEVDVEENPPYSGIVVMLPEQEYNNGELEIDRCFIVLDNHPCEKCYPETAWENIGKLIEDPDLIKIFKK